MNKNIKLMNGLRCVCVCVCVCVCRDSLVAKSCSTLSMTPHEL